MADDSREDFDGKNEFDDDEAQDKPTQQHLTDQGSPAKSQRKAENGIQKDSAREPNPPSVIKMPSRAQVNDQRSEIAQLLDINQKLRNDLRELARAADDAIQRERERKVAKFTGNSSNTDPELRDLTKQLKEKNDQLEKCKYQISIYKRQLEKSYNISK
jgi:predicted RNase H-like nuclease (RuvC/YqgF family)